jgi:hypothetical protein
VRSAPLLVLVAACGGSSAVPDARTDIDAQPLDAPISDATPPACDLSQPFGGVAFVQGIESDQDERYVIPMADLRSVFVTSDRPDFGDDDVYVATRAAASDPFDAPMPIALDTTTGSEQLSWLAADGLTALVVEDGEIYVATRTSTSGEFGSLAAVTDVNDTSTELDPFLSASGALYFASDRTGDFALYRAAPAGGGHFATPAVIAELETGAQELRPVLTDDERTIYFTRDGVVSVAHRSSATATFGAVLAETDLVDEPSSTTLVSWVSGDGCQILFTTDGISGPAGLEPFTAVKPPP